MSPSTRPMTLAQLSVTPFKTVRGVLDCAEVDNCLYSIVRPLIVKEESLQEDGKSLSLTLGVNKDCPNTKYLVSVSFGVRSESNNCEGLRNTSGQSLSPGDSATFSVDSFGLPSNDYCYILSISQETGWYFLAY